VEGVAAGGASSEGSGSVEPFPGEGAMEGSLAMPEGGKTTQRVFVVEAAAGRGGTGLRVTRVEELEGGDARRACKGGPSEGTLPGFCQLKGPCVSTLRFCEDNPPPRSIGWFLETDDRGLIACKEGFDDGCNAVGCEGSRFDSKEECEVQCLGPVVLGGDGLGSPTPAEAPTPMSISEGTTRSGGASSSAGSSNILESADAPGPSGSALVLKLSAVCALAWTAWMCVALGS
jgi:hypothetical protein